MGGEIGVESEAGKGSTFFFDIPLVRIAGENDQPAAVQAPLARPDARPLRVLLAEDNKVNQQFLLAILAKARREGGARGKRPSGGRLDVPRRFRRRAHGHADAGARRRTGDQGNPRPSRTQMPRADRRADGPMR